MDQPLQSSVTELTNILRKWEEEHTTYNYDPLPTLTRLSEIFETESKHYLKKNPDPFDDRHPSRIDPTCILGQMYKILFKKDDLMNVLVQEYLRDLYPRKPLENRLLNSAACRFVLNLIPGLETTVVFESPANDELIQKLFSWAENDCEPLQTYATGLLASCMELSDIAANFKEDNNRLVPIVLDRLQVFYAQYCEENQNTKPFSILNIDQTTKENTLVRPSSKKKMRISHSSDLIDDNAVDSHQDVSCGNAPSESKENGVGSDSNSSWFAECYANYWIQIHPLTLTTKLVYSLKYLVPTAEYQDFLSHAYEKNSLSLIMKIINASEKQNGYLTFEALKYLASLVCHKKFATEFVASHGLQKLLLIPRPSIAATGFSICLYYLAYCEESMERICLLPEHILINLVEYALWMLECSHDSSRCHATMFFGYSFHFKVILELFDNHDGLRKLFNVVSTLPNLSSDYLPYNTMTEDAECSARQIIRHVCASLKHYFEAHLHIKAQQIRRAKLRDSALSVSTPMAYNFYTVPNYKSTRQPRTEVYEEIELLSNTMSTKSHWTPVDQFIKLGGINLVLKIISLAHDWNFSGRCELIRNSLDVLNICAVLPKVQLLLCEPPIKTPRDLTNDSVMDDDEDDDDDENSNDNVGLNIVIKSAEGDLLDADIQKAALSVIITCVCAPIQREGGTIAYYSIYGSAKKRTPKTNDDAVIEKVWDCIRRNNGIMVLLTLMTIKTPITDVDAIRGLASRALAGLARSESVRQIISKLPLFNNGQLQNLMKNPVLQEKRQEHVTFQKYALELMELVSGKTKTNGAEIEASLANINKANIVASTKINFNEQQLLLLVHQHLVAKGLNKTADTLSQEADLNIPEKKSALFTYASHCRNRSIGGGMSPISSRFPAIQNQKSDNSFSSTGVLNSSFNARGNNSSSPIRLCVNRRSEIRPKLEVEPETDSPKSKLAHKKIDQDIPLSFENNSSSTVSLESIVTEYLTNQHASCKHPMVTCPQFNLFVPHKCPDPKPRNKICTNFAMRFANNIHSRKLDQRLIHSRFCPTQMFHIDDEDAYFTCVEFLNLNRIAMGTYNGEIKLYNTFTCQEIESITAHDSYIVNLECSNNSRILLSSASWRTPLTKVWALSDQLLENNNSELLYALNHEEFCTFSNYDQSKLIGTKAEIATIYDVETSKKIMTLSPRLSNQYNKNRAVFDPTNELVLSDGVLWDALSGKEIHKFDKLNQNVSGIFHPSGIEIISNTEVWDVRTFQLLHTVPSLDQCSVTFSKSGEGMYAYVIDQELDDDSIYQTSFKTLDPHDYSNIATVDVKKYIYHVACNASDTQLGIVENQGIYENIDESIVRIYDVGRTRSDDEKVDEEDDEDVDSEGSGSDDEALYPSMLEEMIGGRLNDDELSSTSSSSSSDSSNEGN